VTLMDVHEFCGCGLCIGVIELRLDYRLGLLRPHHALSLQ